MNVRDCVGVDTVSIGVGDIACGTVLPGYISMVTAGFADNETFDYSIRHQSLIEWEVGNGTYHAGTNSFTRDTVTRSSNANALVNFSAGTKFVVMTLSERLMNKLVNLGAKVLLGTEVAGEPISLTVGDGLMIENGALKATPPTPPWYSPEDDYEYPTPVPGPRGDTGTPGTSIQGPTGPAVFLEAEPGEDGMPVPGAKGDAGASVQGPTGPAIYLEAEPGEDGMPVPGAPGGMGLTGTQGPIGPALFLEAEPGEDGTPVPGAAGGIGLTGTQGPIGPAIYLEAEPGEDGMPIPGAVGNVGLTGTQGPIGPAVYLEAEPGEDAITIPGPTSPMLSGGTFIEGNAAGGAGITGTVTIPGWATHVQIDGIRGGDGGGSGRVGAVSTTRRAGNGGDGGQFFRQLFLVSDLGTYSLFYSIGAAGAGGAAVGTAAANGNAGTAGGDISVQVNNASGKWLIVVRANNNTAGGIGGDAVASNSPNNTFLAAGLENSGQGGQAGFAANSTNIAPPWTCQAGAGGGYGTSISGANATTTGVSGAVAMTDGANQGSGLSNVVNTPVAGSGGAGGAVAGSNGANGRNYGGGGGGGSCNTTGSTGGKGGDGGLPCLRIRWW